MGTTCETGHPTCNHFFKVRQVPNLHRAASSMGEPIKHVAIQQNQKEFDTGLFSCFTDCKSCLCGLLCMPCLVCAITKRLDEPCWSCCCLQGMRTKLRTMYGISGSVCMDEVCTGCCYSLVACQMDRELTHLGL